MKTLLKLFCFIPMLVATQAMRADVCSTPWTDNDVIISNTTVNYSSIIDISCASSVTISMDIEGIGNMENADYLNIYYRIDGGQQQTIAEHVNTISLQTIQANSITGNSLELIIVGATSINTEVYTVSNINISANGTTPTTTIRIEENEVGFCLVDGTIDNNHTGFSGDGFANTANVLDNGIDTKIDGDAGDYTFTWRFANGSSVNRLSRLIVNGVTITDNIPFVSTSSWSSWSTTTATVTLTAGIKEVRLEAMTSSGLANIDYVEIESVNVAAYSCTAVVGDCQSFYQGFSLAQQNPGCSNNDGTITVNFSDEPNYTALQLSIDGGNTYPITVNDNTGSYTFNGLAGAEYEIAARYTDATCSFNVGHLILVQDCGSIPLNPGGVSWMDSYEGNGYCWCSTNFDHNLSSKQVTINGTLYSVEDICEELELHPLYRTRISSDNIYNDIQCGNGPINDSSDEPLCPGRVDIGVGGCLENGHHWDMVWLANRDRFGASNAKLNAHATENKSDIYLFPTLADDRIDLVGVNYGEKFMIYSVSGQLVDQSIFLGTIDVSALSAGNYLVVTSSASIRFTKK